MDFFWVVNLHNSAGTEKSMNAYQRICNKTHIYAAFGLKIQL